MIEIIAVVFIVAIINFAVAFVIFYAYCSVVDLSGSIEALSQMKDTSVSKRRRRHD